MHDNVLEIRNLQTEILTINGIIHAVRGVNLDIAKGEVHGIVGESGCGKSVMMKSVMRLHDETKVDYSGSISLEGRDILKMSSKELENLRGQKISMIFQNPMNALNPIMRIGDQIAEGLIQRGISRKEAKKKACGMLEKVGITPAQERYLQYPFEMSGGLLQRVMIAMAMVTDPEILIADEPTTALDVTIQAQILSLMKQVRKDTGVSIIFITHDLGVIAEMCDSVSVMYAGRIVESGSVFDIFDHPAHPYTKALLASKPDGADTSRRMTTIPGAPPSLYEELKGCAFAPRCPYCSEECRRSMPDRKDVADNHYAYCHHSQEFFEKGEIANGK